MIHWYPNQYISMKPPLSNHQHPPVDLCHGQQMVFLDDGHHSHLGNP